MINQTIYQETLAKFGMTESDVEIVTSSPHDWRTFLFERNDQFFVIRPGVPEPDWDIGGDIRVDVSDEDDDGTITVTNDDVLNWMTERGFVLDAVGGLDGDINTYWSHPETGATGFINQYISRCWFTAEMVTRDDKLALDFKLRWTA